MKTGDVLNDQVKPYNPHENKTEQLISLFNKISANYDRFNNLISWGMAHVWRKKSVSLLKQFKPEKILDIATGTGDMILITDKLLKPKTIIGIDIATEMLEIGKQKIAKNNPNAQIDFEVGNAAAMSFENETFDAVTISFGIRNLEQLSQSLREINRVLKTNGHFLILEVNQPEKGMMLLLYKLYIRLNMLFAIKLIGKSDYKYLINSMSVFPRGEKLIKILESSGFELVRYRPFTFDVCSTYLLRKTN